MSLVMTTELPEVGVVTERPEVVAVKTTAAPARAKEEAAAKSFAALKAVLKRSAGLAASPLKEMVAVPNPNGGFVMVTRTIDRR